MDTVSEAPDSGLRDRVLSRTRKLLTGCVVWMGATHPESGYGQISYRGKRFQVHRAIWQSEHGPIPDGLVIRHLCAVRECVNLQHLAIGTQADNVRDTVERGMAHGARGIHNGNGKLGDDQVAEIRRRFIPGTRANSGSGSSSAELAREFGITPQYVTQLARGQWRNHG